MPRDRLERTVVLNEVRELDRQHRMREGMMKRINANPALKNAYETLVKDLPEDQKEGVIAQITRTGTAGRCPHQGNSNKGRKVLASESALRLPQSQPNTEACRSSRLPCIFSGMSPCKTRGNSSNSHFTECIHLLLSAYIM